MRYTIISLKIYDISINHNNLLCESVQGKQLLVELVSRQRSSLFDVVESNEKSISSNGRA
jgi:hypothetical protein